MNYEEVCERVDQLNTRGIHPGIEGISALCGVLSNPEKKLKYVHVAGTDGKGSVSNFLFNILRKNGYRVGMFSSPAVFSRQEIIRLGGRDISKKDYAEYFDRVLEANSFGCTRFECECAAAFLYFAEKEADIVIVEAGMGGLLDATNIIPAPEMAVFTMIGMDHMQYLGDSLEAIGRNKAGIIKEGSLVVSTVQEPCVEAVLDEKSASFGGQVVYSDYAKALKVKRSLKETSFCFEGLEKLTIHTLGSFQIQNACLAVTGALALREKGYSISEKSIYEGLLATVMPGRFECVCEKPLFFLDGAHNVPAARVLKDTLEGYFDKKHFIFILGMLRDKEYEKVVDITTPLAEMVLTVATPNKARTLSSFELAQTVSKVNPAVTSMDSIEEAVEFALMMAKKDTVIVTFGSLSHLEAVKQAVLNRRMQKKDFHGVV